MFEKELEFKLFMRLAAFFPGERPRGMVELGEIEMLAVERIITTWEGLDNMRAPGKGFAPDEQTPKEYLEAILKWNRARTASKPHPLYTAATAAKLSGKEAEVVKLIADKGGRVSKSVAAFEIEGDAISAFKRASPKLRKLKTNRWNLYQNDNDLCAEPIS